jgi:hypothetical protein
LVKRGEIDGAEPGITKQYNSEYHNFMEQIESKIGRYVTGFRHLENFANYSLVHKNATIDEYQTEMYRQVELTEFISIKRQWYIEVSEYPTFKSELPEGKNPLDFANSHDFDELCRKDYVQKVQAALLEKKVFTLVEALEENMDVWNLGRNMWDVPVHNTYVPVRHTIMPKPDLQDTKRDDLAFRFNERDNDRQQTEQRVNPVGQLNPLKGYRMGPAASPRFIADHRPENKKWSKWRRLSKIKNNRAFSTVVDQDASAKSFAQAQV